MNIELSKKQFKFLLELAYLGNWIVNSGNEPDVIDENYEEVANLIYSYGPKADLGKYVAFSKHSNAWVPTNYLCMESDAAKLLEEYNDRNFWSHFSEHLALKDFYNKYDEEKIRKMSSGERFEKVYDLMEKYKNETYDHNFDRFQIIRRIPDEK